MNISNNLNFKDTQRDVLHKNRKVGSSLNNIKVESMIEYLSGDYAYDIGYIPNGFEGRPDLISNIFYGTPNLIWILMYANGISDPFEGFTLNRKIKIPKL